MTLATISVLILTLTFFLLNKKLPFQVCPICAGVTLTWAGMFLGVYLDIFPASYLWPSAIFAGGTVVGAMSKLENSIKTKYILPWKTSFVLGGFAAVYSLTAQKIAGVIGGALISALVTFLFRKYGRLANPNTRKLEEEMKGCC